MKTAWTIKQSSQFELEVKKSRFIAVLQPADSREVALVKIDEASQQYPDARHVCWAFVCGSVGNYSDYGFSDDGEPSGTAGKPILSVLQYNPVTDICAIVIRYFGGIKLGAGGLVRAYSGSASEALAQAELVEIVPRQTLLLSLPYALEDQVRHLTIKLGGTVSQPKYSEKVVFTVDLPQSHTREFEKFCADAGKGNVHIRFVDNQLER